MDTQLIIYPNLGANLPFYTPIKATHPHSDASHHNRIEQKSSPIPLSLIMPLFSLFTCPEWIYICSTLFYSILFYSTSTVLLYSIQHTHTLLFSFLSFSFLNLSVSQVSQLVSRSVTSVLLSQRRGKGLRIRISNLIFKNLLSSLHHHVLLLLLLQLLLFLLLQIIQTSCLVLVFWWFLVPFTLCCLCLC